MSGNRSENTNRHRNVSLTSNASSSSFKDNSTVQQHHHHPRTSDTPDPRSNKSPRPPTKPNGRPVRDRPRGRISSLNLSLQDLPRPTSLFETSSSLNQSMDHSKSDGENRELQEKVNDLQQRKWQYENVMSQFHQLQSSFNGDYHLQQHQSNNGAVFVQAPAPHNRARKLQEAQQKLIQLQELMQNVSIDLDCDPFSRQNEDSKNNKPNLSIIKEFPSEFLRNVHSNGAARPPPAPRANPRQLNKVFAQQHCPLQQNNLSQDPLSSPKRYSTPQANGSLVDVFDRSEPSLDSSDEEESAVEIDDDPTDLNEEVNVTNSHYLNGGESSTVNTARISLDHLERIEHQLERTNSLCEMVAVEQRRLAMVTDSLVSAVTDLQQQATRPAAFQNGGFSLSSLPIVNPGWNENGGGSDVQLMGQAINQCCLLLTQLQRDLSSVQQSLDTSPQAQLPGYSRAAAGVAVHHSPYREEAKSRTSAYECNMDRFDAGVTLNNRVPPGTRTNNYWDNFRSYSRQNLLSSGPSNVTADDHLADMVLHSRSSQVTASPRQVNSTRRSDPPPPRRTKRKVNKGQRQVEIGVRSPHADNRALAYGLLSVRSAATSETNAIAAASSGGERNLNPPQQLVPNNEVVVSSTTTSTTVPDVSHNKVAKDTSTLKYSGARPKENRRPAEASTCPNVNLLAGRESLDAHHQDHNGLETVIRTAVMEHSASPHFISQLLELLQKFNSDPLRQMALNTLQGMVNQPQPGQQQLQQLQQQHQQQQSELQRLFDSVVVNQRELTPNLLEDFLGLVQQNAVDDYDPMEGAAAVVSSPDDNNVYLVRHALTPFLFRRLSEVRDMIGETLTKLESGTQPPTQPVVFNQQREATATAASITSGREDDLAEADQSCDGMAGDGTSVSADLSITVSASQEWNESAESVSNRHSVIGLDEVPTRLMSILAAPVWSRPRSSPNSEASRQRTEPESSTWFPEDNSI